MNKILIIFLLMGLMLTGCEQRTGSLTKDDSPIQCEVIAGNGSFEGPELEIMEITYNGETHEYLHFCAAYEGSLSHWEGCKYCKNK